MRIQQINMYDRGYQTATSLVYETAIKQSKAQRFDGTKRSLIGLTKYATSLAIALPISMATTDSVVNSLLDYGNLHPTLRIAATAGAYIVSLSTSLIGSSTILNFNWNIDKAKTHYRQKRVKKFEEKAIKRLEKNGYQFENNKVLTTDGLENTDTLKATRAFLNAKAHLTENHRMLIDFAVQSEQYSPL